MLLVDAYKADNRASEWYSAFEAAKSDTRYCAAGSTSRRRLEESSGGRVDTLTLVYLRKPLHRDAIRSPALHDAQRVEKDLILTVFADQGWRDPASPRTGTKQLRRETARPGRATQRALLLDWLGTNDGLGIARSGTSHDLDGPDWRRQRVLLGEFWDRPPEVGDHALHVHVPGHRRLRVQDVARRPRLAENTPGMGDVVVNNAAPVAAGRHQHAEVASALGLDMVLCGIALVLVFAALIAHMRSPVLAIVAMGQVLVSIPVAQYFYLRVFDVYIIYLLNFLSVFIVAGIGADDAFLFFDTLAQTMVERQHKREGLRRVTALHDCKGDRKDELSFKKGDVLIVEDEAGDGWCRGRLAVGVGKFPARTSRPATSRGASLRSSTAVPDAQPKRASSSSRRAPKSWWRTTRTQRRGAGRSRPGAPPVGSRLRMSLAGSATRPFDCDADAQDELGFYEGDVIEVSDQSDPDWWVGS